MNFRTSLFLMTAVVMMVATGCGPAGSTPAESITESNLSGENAATAPAIAAQLEEVSQVRRLLRSACGPLRSAGSQQDESQARAQIAFATSQTEQALSQWQSFVGRHRQQPPAAYVGHDQWQVVANDIEKGIEQMLRQAQQGQPTPAFQACGRTCGLFVEMNEKAGLRRTSDVLFHFRRAGRAVAEPATAGNVAPIIAALDRLEQLGDAALRDPVGGIGAADQKHQALKSFSEAVDAFARAARENQQEQLGRLHAHMMSSMEKAYDLFL